MYLSDNASVPWCKTRSFSYQTAKKHPFYKSYMTALVLEKIYSISVFFKAYKSVFDSTLCPWFGLHFNFHLYKANYKYTKNTTHGNCSHGSASTCILINKGTHFVSFEEAGLVLPGLSWLDTVLLIITMYQVPHFPLVLWICCLLIQSTAASWLSLHYMI